MALFSNDEDREKKNLEFFGFEIRRKTKPEDSKKQVDSIVPPVDDTEGAYITTAAGYFGQILDVRGDFSANDRSLILKYRNASLQAECDDAIENIVNEAIVADDETIPVSLNLDQVDNDILDDASRDLLQEEFDHVLKLLNFRKYGHDMFRRWYVDGRIAFHKVIDMKNTKDGLQDIRPIDVIKLQKIIEIDDQEKIIGNVNIPKIKDQYFLYSEDGFGTAAQKTTPYASSDMNTNGIKLPVDSVTYVTSGLTDATRGSPLSHLHKALRNVNQLRMMEDALIIYRLARAPERRIFYIDTGNLPTKKAEEYVKSLMAKFRNKIVYNAKTGEMAQDAKHMSIMEDFWLPRRADGKGTEISTLPGGENLSQIADIEYFQKKLFQALNVPIGRLTDSQNNFNLGKAAEITRDEIKFQKFINRLRVRFSELFKDCLKTQVILKGIMTSDEWDEIKEYIIIDYQKDNYFTELKEAEMTNNRLSLLEQIDPYIGKFYSEEYVLKNILQLDEEAIKQMREEIYNEAIRRKTELPIPSRPDDGPGGGQGPQFGGGGGGFNSSPQPGEGQPGPISPPETGLGGINNIAPPPPEGEEEESDNDENNEPTLNTNVEFPTLPGQEGQEEDEEEDDEKR